MILTENCEDNKPQIYLPYNLNVTNRAIMNAKPESWYQ